MYKSQESLQKSTSIIHRHKLQRKKYKCVLFLPKIKNKSLLKSTEMINKVLQQIHILTQEKD